MQQTETHHIKIIKRHRTPTPEARALKHTLEKHGVRVLFELYDGYKHIDLAIPDAKLNVEVDGIQHLTNPHQILADLGRGYYSHKKGYSTMHISNEMVQGHLEEIAKALAEAVRVRSEKIHIHMN